MHLKASQIEYPDRVFKVNVKETLNIYPQETERKWIDALSNSLGIKGMLHPILVCTEDNLKDHLHTILRHTPEYTGHRWRVLVGNNRYHYAVANGYTSIDAYEIKSVEDYELLHHATVLEAHQF